jgi:hypothetical protein
MNIECTSGIVGEKRDAVDSDVKICYSREELLKIAREIEPLSEEYANMMLAEVGYVSIDLVVDIHPDNLLPSNKKKGGGKTSSKSKKKTKKNEAFGDQSQQEGSHRHTSLPTPAKHSDICNRKAINSNDQCRSEDVSASSNIKSMSENDVPCFSAGEALAWANALETNVQSALGAHCSILLSEDSSTHNEVSACSGGADNASVAYVVVEES